MNERETRRSGVLDRVKSEELTQVEAAEILGLSYRQTKRLYRRFLKLGAKGLMHGHVGKRSNHAKEARFRRRVLALVPSITAASQESGSDRHWRRNI